MTTAAMPSLPRDCEFKDADLAVKSPDGPGDGGGVLEGIGAAFMNMDGSGDIIAPGAFADSLPKFLSDGFIGGLNHDWRNPLGHPIEARETADGLYIKAVFDDTTDARDVRAKLTPHPESGRATIRKLSIGYRTLESKDLRGPDEIKSYWKSVNYTPRPDDMARAESRKRARVLTRIDLFEVSPVVKPANDLAVVLSAKADEDVTGVTGQEDYEVVPEAKVGKPINAARASMWRKTIISMRAMLDQMEADLDAAHPEPGKADASGDGKTDGITPVSFSTEPEPETKGVVPYKAGPILEAATWDGGAAETRVRKWASSDGSGDKDKIDWGKLRQAYAYVDADGEGSSFGAYHLLHHDIDGGTLKVARRGVFAAAVIIQGGRGGGAAFVAKIGEAAADGIRAHLGKHYKDMDITAPWDQGKADDALESPEADLTQPPEAKADEPPAKVPHDDVARLFAKYMIEFEAPRLGLSTNGSH